MHAVRLASLGEDGERGGWLANGESLPTGDFELRGRDKKNLKRRDDVLNPGDRKGKTMSLKIMILGLVISQSALAICGRTPNVKSRYRIEKVGSMAFACQDMHGKKTGKETPLPSYCLITVVRIDTETRIVVGSEKQNCSLKPGTTVEAELAFLCSDLLDFNECDDAGRPKYPRPLEHVEGATWSAGADWVVVGKMRPLPQHELNRFSVGCAPQKSE
jgi:hypothetical protein